MSARVSILRGWEIVTLGRSGMEAVVCPGKGGDILQVRFGGVPLLFEAPWGLRPRGAVGVAQDSASRWLEAYPGGWQTIFPNGGAASDGYGFHGEAALAPYEFEATDHEIEMRTRLHGAPFTIVRHVAVDADRVVVTERIRNAGSTERDAMWSHHPAFGAPFLAPGCVVEASAATFVADDERDTPAGDLRPGGRGAWPHAIARDGSPVDLSRIPAVGDRFGYLDGFEEGRLAITNPHLGIRATLEWDVRLLPHAWYWLEARATPGYPWFGEAYVLGLEPASTIPGQGIGVARARGANLVLFAPGEERELSVTLRIGRA